MPGLTDVFFPPAPQTNLSLNEAVKSRDASDPELKDDCTPCRAIGSASFIGLGAYSWWEGHKQLNANEKMILTKKPFFGMAARRVGISGVAASLGALGLYRWFMD